MAADPLADVGQNEPFAPSASRENALSEAARWVRARRPGMKSVTTNDLSPITVWVKDDTDFDKSRFDVMAIVETLVTPTENETQFKNVVVFRVMEAGDPETESGKWVVLDELIRAR